jgi:hypothetical protein
MQRTTKVWTYVGHLPHTWKGRELTTVHYVGLQVVKRDGQPDLPVPIYFAYNHHYVSWIKYVQPTPLAGWTKLVSQG